VIGATAPAAAGGAQLPPLSLAFLGDPNSIHVRRVASALASRGHRVTLLVPAGSAVNPGLAAGVDIVTFEPYAARRPVPLGAVAARRSLRRVLEQLNASVLHAHHMTVNGWTARLSGFHPYAVTLWGSDILVTARESLRARMYAAITLAGADLVMADSRSVIEAAIRSGAHPDRTHLVQLGVDVRRYAPGPDPGSLRMALGLVGHRVLFSPRAITPLYRQWVVVDALPSLPDDVIVLMTRHGADPAEVEAIQRRAAARGVADRIRIVAPIANQGMAEAYRLADVVVSVPSSDGTPVTVLEALAVGRPVVASDLPSLREWLADLDPDSLAPVDDVEATARAIRRALDLDPAIRAEVSRRGREIVLRRGDQQENMDELERLYRLLVRVRPPTVPK